ncbi:MAG: valine--tRNA ligase [Oscillospiraceae bacterium]|jgi:valyl-tRNA synthetase|nr:valine--tRNA ligase [Oscillospiraceae bacterium]
MDKTYSPKNFEERIYKLWEENECFSATPNPSKKPYTIVIPPPNITGQLHMGHALNQTYQDILIRFRRMQGYEALWLPGTDHASIATEARVVEQLKREGVQKEELGREGFLSRVWDWKKEYGDRITKQIRKLGSSCDWSRERFTLDEGCNRAVEKVFFDLYEKGKIYRGLRIVNWCPSCKTSISDIESEYEDEDGFFWHISYPLAGGGGSIEIATTRPETLLGDSAVAVHPDDERYKHLVGKTVTLPLTGREIPVIADEYVDKDFGTGAVKITPAHDPNDYEVGLRHDLPFHFMMNEDGTISDECGGKYAGLDRYEARKAIVADLESEGLLVKVMPHKHSVGHCQRCNATVEPLASKQWFVKMKELATPAIDKVKDGSIKFVPERFTHSYLNWMENVRDWCISRQLWWGHRIPAFYCDDCGEITVDISHSDAVKCRKCGGATHQDEDTLDTWFSSALWPFSTLGWPEETNDFKYFYPTATLVTAADIIFFWVARMIFSALEYTGEIPFDTVMLNGIVRDEHGKKMSKSAGNGVDPLQVIDKYGADALRLMLLTGNSPGNDIRWREEKITAARNFANKLWNASRYVLMNLPADFVAEINPDKLAVEDKWVLTKLGDTCDSVTLQLERFELGIAAGKVVDFVWEVLCDWYIELTKVREDKQTALSVLLCALEGGLKLLHPFMPFITEEIYRNLPQRSDDILMKEPWATKNNLLYYPKEAADFEKVAQLIKKLRTLKQEKNIAGKLSVEIETNDVTLFVTSLPFFYQLAATEHATVTTAVSDKQGKTAVITEHATAFLLVDTAEEAARLRKELAIVQKDVAFLTAKLNNAGFVAKAPAAQVDKEREKLNAANEKLSKLLRQSETLS